MEGTVKDWKDAITIAEANANKARNIGKVPGHTIDPNRAARLEYAWSMVAAHIREALRQEGIAI